jgi:putative ABC transport system substrate-binding protein
MKRRRVLSAVVAVALAQAWSAQSSAQPAKTTVIGLLDAGERPDEWTAFGEQMRQLGYVDGRNVAYVHRAAKGNVEAASTLAKELVQQKVAVIVTTGAAAALAAQRATNRIPIVMASGADQVGLGLASSFAKPGGNVTGVSSFTPDLMAKRLELLREIVPGSVRLGALWHKENISSMASVREIDGAAAKLGVAFQSLGISDAEGLDDAFTTMTRQKIDALIVVNSPLMFLLRAKLAALALKHRLPAIFGSTEYVEAGGLIGYGPSYVELARRAANYVDRILKGANPGDLPIELPTTFELAVNAKTARALGLTIPPTMLARANQVVR